jgi:hypothetical protein
MADQNIQMPPVPDEKDIITSDAFRSWCRAVNDYIQDFENRMIRKIAESRESPKRHAGVVQALCPKPFLSQLEDIGLFPMPRYNVDPDTQLLFAPFSESKLSKLSKGNHYLRLNGQEIPVQLKRTHAFLENERKLFCYFNDHMVDYWAKHECLQDLRFPFLPYSRKFIEIEPVEGISDTFSNYDSQSNILETLIIQGNKKLVN